MSNQDYAPPPGPPPSHRVTFQPPTQALGEAPTGRSSELQSNNPWRNAHAATSQEPPQYSASHRPSTNEDYAPPPGPPPSHQQSTEPEPPPYDPWLAVPDNALLPPPPAFHEDRSPTSNASEEDAERATIWCNRNPLWAPRQHTPEVLNRISQGLIALTAPPQTKLIHISRSDGQSKIKSDPKCKDTIFLSDIPLYIATSGRPNTIYFEIKIISIGAGHSFLRSNDAESALAIGLAAPPYPSWRQPGWHRGSLGVHSDDGRRYVDDPYGGQDFTKPFKKGDVIGLGMTFSPPQYANAGSKREVKVFFTRNGKRDGGWDLHEEKDKDQDGGNVFGLEGEHDLLAAVGVFGAVEFEARFRREDWQFKP